MADLLLLSDEPAVVVLPALGLLGHTVRRAPAEATALLDTSAGDGVLLDARRDLSGARSLCRVLRATGLAVPLVLVVGEGGLAALSADWGADDFLLATAGPAEVEARLRILRARAVAVSGTTDGVVHVGDLVVDELTYSAKLRGHPLDLTFKEFELLKYLAQHPGRVFSRAQLLQEVWGYDYYGGTRTVDVHVRRLRAKLGVEHEALIGTVRHVGYKFVAPAAPAEGPGLEPEYRVAPAAVDVRPAATAVAGTFGSARR